MNIQNTLFSMALTILLALTTQGCGKDKKALSSSNLNDDSSALIVESAIGGLSGSLNDSEQTQSFALQTQRSAWDRVVPSAQAAACGLSRFTPAIGSPNCSATSDGKTVLAEFASCTAGPQNEFILSGTITLTFNAPSTCDAWIAGVSNGQFPLSGSVTRTTTNFTRFNPGGSRVIVSSDSHTNYLGQNLGGGARTDFGPSSRSVSILGLKRTRVRADGSSGFSHSVRTTQPIVVTGSRATNNRRITSGELTVDHNVARFSATTAAQGLEWGANCCYPLAGTLSFLLSGSRTGNISADFSTGTCGETLITRGSEPAEKVQLQACE